MPAMGPTLFGSLLLCSLFLVWGVDKVATAQNTGKIRIGTLLGAESWIGKEALRAMQLAVKNINDDTCILNGTVLELMVADSNCSAFQGAAAAIELFGKEVLAIAGPQTSSATYFVAQMAAASQIPLVSFSATDPSLSQDQYPYFVRLAHSDKLQMDAISDLINYFGWREVAALYAKDWGKNGIDALDDSLSDIGAQILQRTALDPDMGQTDIQKMLVQLSQQGLRIFVLHMSSSLSRKVFIEAYNLNMINTGYVWIVSEATASVLNRIFLDDEFVRSVQGVIGVCSDITESPKLQTFMDQWNQSAFSGKNTSSFLPISSYGLYAYDSIWTIGKALDNFLSMKLDIAFVASRRFSTLSGGQTDLAKLKVFQNGSILLQSILGTNFTGITGKIQFDTNGDLMDSSLEVVNMVGKDARVVGYWNNHTGLSSASPSLSLNSTPTIQDIIWPGGSTQVPRGWTFPWVGKPLLIGVPYKQGYKEFVGVTEIGQNISVTGFCIDVFEAACRLLPYPIDYTFIPFGTGHTTPSYDELVQKVVTKDFDGVVGDISITTARTKIVDFTQPYATAGLVVLVPTQNSASNHAWAFMRPFTPAMWLTTFAFFLFSGVVVWTLEHKKNDDFRGAPKKQVINILWFIFSTLFFSQREEVRSTLGKVAVIVWLFVVLIINSSYTASLTSNLTVQQLMPTIQNIGSLIASDVPIGYQTGSYVRDYLTQLVPASRLRNLTSQSDYFTAMKMGYVGAVVDELPYVQLFLSQHCDFTMAGTEFTQGSWGFAFPKGSQLAIDLSQAILQLSENGTLQQIHDNWLSNSDCSSLAVDSSTNMIGLGSFWGLFLITGVTSVVCVIWYYVLMVRRFLQAPENHSFNLQDSGSISRGTSMVRSFFTYVERREEPRSRRGTPAGSSRGRQLSFSGADGNDELSMGREDSIPKG